jgi:hypothetical protein
MMKLGPFIVERTNWQKQTNSPRPLEAFPRLIQAYIETLGPASLEVGSHWMSTPKAWQRRALAQLILIPLKRSTKNGSHLIAINNACHNPTLISRREISTGHAAHHAGSISAAGSFHAWPYPNVGLDRLHRRTLLSQSKNIRYSSYLSCVHFSTF